MTGAPFAPIDYAILAILAIAVLRGLMRGLLRETFSIISIGMAVIAVRLFNDPMASWLMQVTQGRIGDMVVPWVAGGLLAVAAIGVTTLVGRVLRRGARFAGLGWADRAGGAVIGTAEGVLVAGIVVALVGYVVGRAHPVLAGSRSLHAFEQLEQIAESRELRLPDVAGAPPSS